MSAILVVLAFICGVTSLATGFFGFLSSGIVDNLPLPQAIRTLLAVLPFWTLASHCWTDRGVYITDLGYSSFDPEIFCLARVSLFTGCGVFAARIAARNRYSQASLAFRSGLWAGAWGALGTVVVFVESAFI